MTLKEVKALRKEMARIKEENEILKKAMAIYAFILFIYPFNS